MTTGEKQSERIQQIRKEEEKEGALNINFNILFDNI